MGATTSLSNAQRGAPARAMRQLCRWITNSIRHDGRKERSHG